MELTILILDKYLIPELASIVVEYADDTTYNQRKAVIENLSWICHFGSGLKNYRKDGNIMLSEMYAMYAHDKEISIHLAVIPRTLCCAPRCSRVGNRETECSEWSCNRKLKVCEKFDRHEYNSIICPHHKKEFKLSRD